MPVVQASILESISLMAALPLTYLNHTRTRTSSSILLLFWPSYVAALAIWIRTVIGSNYSELRVLLVFRCAVVCSGIFAFGLECIGPEHGTEPSLDDKIVLESPIVTANIFSIWVSGVVPSKYTC